MIGSDPEGRLGEAPRPELREQGRISGACFDAARGIIDGLKVFISPKKKKDYLGHMVTKEKVIKWGLNLTLVLYYR